MKKQIAPAAPVDMDRLKIELLEHLTPQHPPMRVTGSPEELQSALSALMEEGLIVLLDKTRKQLSQIYAATEKAHHLLAATPYSPDNQPWGIQHHRWADLIERAQLEAAQTADHGIGR